MLMIALVAVFAFAGSALVTVAVELILWVILQEAGEALRRKGYRSSNIGPDGIRSSSLVIFIAVSGIVLFSLLCYLPTGLYLLIVGIASVRTILDDTFSLQAAVLLLTGLLILLAAGLIPRLLDRRQPPSDNKKQPPSRRIESTI